MITFGEKLRRLRTQKGLSQEELAKKLNTSKQVVSRYETNQRVPKITVAQEIAKLFDVSLDYLIENVAISNVVAINQNQVFNVPIYNSVSAGFGAAAVDYIVGYMPIYFEHPNSAKDCICINVQGDSMYPKIENGDTIVVNKQTSVDSGSIAVVLIDGEEGLVKKVVYDKNSIELQSINPMYPPVRFEGNEIERVHIVGLVKKIIKNL